MTATFRCQTAGCGKTFTRKDYLERHNANHNTVKPFTCVQCQILFSRKDILEKHYRTKAHHNKRNQLTKFILKEENPVNENTKKRRNTHIEPIIPAPKTSDEVNVLNSSMEENADQGQLVMVLPTLMDNHGSLSELYALNSPLDASIDWLFGDIAISGQNAADFFANIIDSTPPMRESGLNFPEKHFEQLTLHRVSSKLDKLGVTNYTIESFSSYLDNFWTYFISIYPIIHQPTFDPNATDTWLLISMLAIGMCFSSYIENDVDIHDCIVSINTDLRLHIFQEAGDTPNLSQIQALLLNNFCCKLWGTTREIKMSQIFHGTAINFLRHQGYFDKRHGFDAQSFYSLENPEKEVLWKDWIHFETCKRTAFFGFILDSQNACLFRDLQLLSIFEIHLELPSSDALWSCSTLDNFLIEFERQPKELSISTEPSWQTTEDADILLRITINEDKKNRYSKPSMLQIELEGDWPDFLWSLRRLMQPYQKFQKEYHTNCFSQFSRLILLHGILNITWDLKSRSLLDLGFLSKKSLVLLLGRLNLALLNWKGYFEKQIKLSNRAKFGDGLDMLNDYGVSNLFWNTISLYQFARITLNADLGAINELKTEFIKSEGKLSKLSSPSFLRKKHSIQAWTRTVDSKKAVNAACKILNNFTSNMKTVKELPYMSKILYFAGLVIWAHETNTEIRSSPTIPELSKISKQKYSIDGKLDINLVKLDLTDYVMIVVEGKEKSKDIETYRETQQQVIAVLLFISALIHDSNSKEDSDLEQLLEFY